MKLVSGTSAGSNADITGLVLHRAPYTKTRRSARGQATAPPSSVMNSRRLICCPVSREVVGAELDALRNLVGVGVGADHDDRLSGSLLITLRTSSPFKSGIIRSSRTRLNFSFSMSAIASFPPAALAICSCHRIPASIAACIDCPHCLDDEDTREIRCH